MWKRIAVLLAAIAVAPLLRIEMRCPQSFAAKTTLEALQSERCKSTWRIVWPWWRTFRAKS